MTITQMLRPTNQRVVLEAKVRQGRLRRKRELLDQSQEQREDCELILNRAKYLPPRLRELIAARYEVGLTIQRLARLHRMSGRAIRAELDRVKRSLLAPEFSLFVRYHAELEREQRDIVRAILVDGQSYRVVAHIRGCSVHHVRQTYLLAAQRLKELFVLEQHRVRRDVVLEE